MIFVLNKAGKVLKTFSRSGDLKKIDVYFNDTFKEILNGGESFSFSTSVKENTSYFEIGNYIAYKYKNKLKLLQIIETEEEHQDYIIQNVYCETAGLELINEIVRPKNLGNVNIRQFLNSVLGDTDWKIGFVDSSITDVLTVDITDYQGVYELLQSYASKFKYELDFVVDIENNIVMGKYIDVYQTKGKFKGQRFVYNKSIKGISRKINGMELVTALIGVGSKDVTFKSIEVKDGQGNIIKPLGQDFVTNKESFDKYNNRGNHIFGIFKYDTESPEELYKKTIEQLENLKAPHITYEVDVALLNDIPSIGDTVFIVDNDISPRISLAARIAILETSESDPLKSKATFTNFIEVKSGITEEMRQLAGQLEGYVESKFPIGTGDIKDDAITSDKINDQYTQTIKTDILEAAKAEIGELIADKATIGQLEAAKAEIGELIADKATIGQLEAANAEIGNLKADVADIDHLLAGNITADNIAAGTIIAGSGIIADGAIGSAQISDLNADKLTAGTLDTSKITVAGAGNNLSIKGNRLQVFEGLGPAATERVSLGDVNNDGTRYGLRVRGKDGTTILYDENGVYNEGITDGAITNDKVNPDAAIDGTKLNINSVVTEINGATEKISGLSISVDGTNLNTKLSTIETTQTEQEKTIINNTAAIAANEKEIKFKVDSQEYEEDQTGLKKSIEKNTAELKILENNIDLKVSENIAKIGIGANNYIKNSGNFKNTQYWSNNVTIKDNNLSGSGQIVNYTDIELDQDNYYVFSAEIKLPTDFIMTEENILKYIRIGE